ncbi:hypothetical protein LTR17_004946 [Elasticomyces elasticus]|nr:hypothetical protein LTR17_004946 [Elasticomyces elasticus]
MTRRILRTLTQLALLTTLISLFVFLADSRYRVLPTSIHDRLPTHHTGSVVTDITVTFCSSANPFSTCKLSEDEGWRRVEKDLYLGSGWLQSAWVHVKRKQEEELTAGEKVVVGVRVGRLNPGVADGEDWERREAGVWVLRSGRRHDSDSDPAVTAVDVLFGADAVDPRAGWVLSGTPLLVESGRGLQQARLSVRHGRHNVKSEEKTRDAQLRVRKDGTFKILQISDAHLSTGTGVCRDAIDASGQPSTNCEADVRTLEFLESILDSESPDLVILSGDQVEGPSSPDTQSTLFKLAAPLIERKLPYGAIFGNHDDESSVSLSRSAQMGILQNLPYSLSQPGPADVDGIGNYVLEILAPGSSQHSALTIYMLDSHSLSPDEKRFKGYDWIKPSQISWFKSTAQSLRKAHAKYSHFHLDMAFIHIPLPEYAEKNLLVKGGEWREGVTAPGFNSHFYDALVEEGVVAVGCGHDHVNDYCALRPSTSTAAGEAHENDHGIKEGNLGPWMCYAGGSGFGGYAGYAMDLPTDGTSLIVAEISAIAAFSASPNPPSAAISPSPMPAHISLFSEIDKA